MLKLKDNIVRRKNAQWGTDKNLCMFHTGTTERAAVCLARSQSQCQWGDSTRRGQRPKKSYHLYRAREAGRALEELKFIHLVPKTNWRRASSRKLGGGSQSPSQ